VTCPTGWQSYNDKCYYPSSEAEATDQRTARANCVAMGGDLVSITDQDEMDFVLSISYELKWIISILIKFISGNRGP